MDYRKELYSHYVSENTSHLYGEVCLNNIKRQFPVWNKYYGRHLPKSKGIEILEIGCGYGGFLYYLKELGYTNHLGIDVSGEQIDLARKLGIENVKRTDLKEFLKEKKETYDVIIARDVLEHFKKDELLDILKLIYTSLSKGGKFIIQAPNAESPFGGRYRYGDFTHEISFIRGSLAQILRVVGFRKIGFYPTGPVIHGIKSAIRYFLWKIIEIFLRFYILVETGSRAGIFTQNLIAVVKK